MPEPAAAASNRRRSSDILEESSDIISRRRVEGLKFEPAPAAPFLTIIVSAACESETEADPGRT
jgi:hypothetical protein